MSGVRPLGDDPGAEHIRGMIDASQGEWILPSAGDFTAGAVECMKRDGSGHQFAIAVQWPGRVNNSEELRDVRVLIDPRDAVELAKVLLTSARWLLSVHPEVAKQGDWG